MNSVYRIFAVLYLAKIFLLGYSIVISARVIVVMGVAGSGKTSVGICLANSLQIPFFDADDYHSRANKTKMAAGVALTDADRADWLETLAGLLKQAIMSGCVLACSALKEQYRQVLTRHAKVIFVYLQGSQDLIEKRLATRAHFFHPDLLCSQFAALEEPSNAIVQSIELPLEQIIENIVQALERTS